MKPVTKRRLIGLFSQPRAHDRVIAAQCREVIVAAAPRPLWRRLVAMALVAVQVVHGALVAAPAFAQVTAAPGAASGQRPLIDRAANGVPVIHIAPPSAAGISRNQYGQFDVPTGGLILNNSAQNVLTQQGGMVAGNRQLGGTPARIILNEVSGSAASQLRGTLEVAGQRADIVIANPNGIVCDGCAFLNTAGRASLVAGNAQIGADGSLQGFASTGNLTVGARGLNAANQEQLDLIARGLVIEGEVWAQNIQAIAGANRVLYGTLSATSIGQGGITGAGQFAIDIRDVGGMYANRIFLVATERGLGVNSTGRLAALQGNLVLSSSGDLTIRDAYARRDIEATAQGRLAVDGQVHAEGVLKLNAQQLHNRGTLAQHASATALNLAGSELRNDGTVYSAGDLNVNAARIAGSAGRGGAQAGLLATGNLRVQGAEVDLPGHRLGADQGLVVVAQNAELGGTRITAAQDIRLSAAGSLGLASATVAANGLIQVTGGITSVERASVTAGGTVAIQSLQGRLAASALQAAGASTVDLAGTGVQASGSQLSAQTVLTLSGGALTVDLGAAQAVAGEQLRIRGHGVSIAHGTASAPEILIDAGQALLDNNHGRVLASGAGAQALRIAGLGVANAQGQIRANAGLAIDARGGDLDNRGGWVAGQGAQLEGVATLRNADGAITLGGDLALRGGLSNARGTITTGGALSIQSTGAPIDNSGGTLHAAGSLSVSASGGTVVGEGGTFMAGQAASVSGGALQLAGATVSAGTGLTVEGGQLSAQGASFVSDANVSLLISQAALLQDANLSAGGSLSLSAGAVQAGGARVAAGGDLSLSASQLRGGLWAAQGNLTAATTGLLDVGGGGLVAGGRLAASGQGIVTDGAQVGGATVRLDAGSGTLSNRGGVISATGTGGTETLHVTASGIVNAGGTLRSSGGAMLDARAGAIDNTGGTIQIEGVLQTRASELRNRRGTLATASDLRWVGQSLDNQGGTIQSGGTLVLDTRGHQLDNTAGRLIAGRDLSLQADRIETTGGTIAANGMTRIQGQVLSGERAQLTGVQGLDVQVVGHADLRSARLQSAQTVSVVGQSATATQASITAGGSLSFQVQGALVAQDARVAAQGTQAGSLRMEGATLALEGASVRGDGGVALVATQGSLTASRAQLVSAAGMQVVAQGPVALSEAQVDVQGDLLARAATADAMGVALRADQARLQAAGAIAVQAGPGAALLERAQVTAGATLSVQGEGITATSAQLSAHGELSVDAGSADMAAQGATLRSATGDVSVSGGAIDLSQAAAGPARQTGAVAGGNLALIAGRGAIRLDNAMAVAIGNVTVQAPGALHNQGGLLVAGGRADVQASRLQNDGGVVDGQAAVALRVAAGSTLGNTHGRIASRGALTVDAQGSALDTVTNQGGVLESGTWLSLSFNRLDSRQGTVTALGALDLRGGAIDAAQALLAGVGDVSLGTSGGGLDLAGARLLSQQGSVVIRAGTVDLSGGTVAAAADLDLGSGQTRAREAQLNAGRSATLTLDNLELDQGSLRAGASVTVQVQGAVTAQQLVLEAGTSAQISAGSGLDLSAASVTAQSVDLAAGDGLLRTSQADVRAASTAAGALRLQGRGLANAGGSAASAGGLWVDAGAGAIDNSGGRLHAVGNATLASTGLDNRQGQVVANAGVTMDARVADAGAGLDNRAGMLASAQGDVHVIAGSLRNEALVAGGAAGTVLAGRDVSVQLAAGLGNQGAQVQAGRDLVVRAGGEIDNRGASLIGQRHVTLQASGVRNDAGTLAAGSDLNLAVGPGGVGNAAGLLQAGAAATLQSAGAWDNANGQVLAGGSLRLGAAHLAAQNSQIGSQAGAVDLAVSSADLRQASVASGATLTVAAGTGAIQAQGARLSSAGAMALQGGATQLTDASLQAGGDLALRTAQLEAERAQAQATGSLLVTATGAVSATQLSALSGGHLAIVGGGAVALEAAQLAANGSIRVRGTDIDARRIDLATPGDASVVASGSLHIRDGRLVAGQDLETRGAGNGDQQDAWVMAGRDLVIGNGARFAFAAPGLTYQFGRDLTVQAQGIDTAGQNVAARNLTLDAGAGLLDNTAGTLQAMGALSVRGNGIANAGGQIFADGDVAADATVGTLANAGGRIYSSQGSLYAAGGHIANATGVISGARDVSLAGGGLDNTGNQIAAGGNLTVNLSGHLANAGGLLVANSGSAAVQAGSIDNSNARINAAGTASLSTASTLFNQGGVVFGNDVSVSGGVQNGGGVISALNRLTLAGGSIDNNAGVIESGAGGIAIDAAGQHIANGASGSNRGIVSTGVVSINAGSIANSGGYIGGHRGIAINAGSIDNRGGALVGLSDGNTGTSSVSAAGELNNSGGAIVATANLNVAAGTLNNSGASTIFAVGNLSVVAGSIDNSGTRSSDWRYGLLSGNDININAGSLDNRNGAIVALRHVDIRATGSLDNSGGQVSGHNVTLTTGALANTGGRIDAQGELKLNAPAFSADGIVAAGGGLVLETTGDYINNASVSTGGNLRISTTGQYTNNNLISATGNLALTASGLANSATGQIRAAATTVDVGGGTVVNQGEINSSAGTTQIRAGSIGNTGVIYGDGVNLTGAVSNSASAGGAGAVIASRAGDVNLTGSLTNTGQSLVMALGNITVNGNVDNHGSTLNASGHVVINGNLSNTNAGLTTTTQERTESLNQRYIVPTWTTRRYATSELGWHNDEGGQWVVDSEQYPLAQFGASGRAPASQVVCTGGAEGGECAEVMNYGPSDPAWALFGVAPPPAPPVLPEGDSCRLSAGETGADAGRSYAGACAAYWPAFDAYQAAAPAAYGELNGRIAAFNADLVNRSLVNWYEIDVNSRRVTETVVTGSQPGQVLAGGSIIIGAGVNRDSIITAGASVSGGIDNQSTMAPRTSTDEGVMRFNERHWHGGFSQSYSRSLSPDQAYSGGTTTTTAPLNIFQYGVGSVNPPGSAPNNPPTGGAAPQVVTSIGATAGGGGASSGTAQRNGSVATGSANATAGPGVVVNVVAPSAGSGLGTSTAVAAGSATVVTTPAGSTPSIVSRTVALSGGSTAPLPGSVIAAGARAAQAQVIGSVLTQFAQIAGARPPPRQSLNGVSPEAPRPPAVRGAGYTTVTSPPRVRAPSNQLFNVNAPGATHLVETDPRFTDPNRFTGSDLLLSELGIDPETLLRRYGDAFAEQRLIDDQILALTGRRFIAGYGSTEEQYRDLLNAGAQVASQFQLTPGVALTAEQMSALTTDIVWLTRQTVTLADGSTTEALVPQVYLRRPNSGDLTPAGALISGSDIHLANPGGSLTNSGTIYAHGGGNASGQGSLSVTGANITNSGTLAGHQLAVVATQDIRNLGGQVLGLGATSTAVLSAGRNIVIQSTTQTTSQTLAGANGSTEVSRTNVDRVATISAGNVVLASLGNIDLQGAVVQATGGLRVSATGAITVGAVTESYTLNVPLGGRQFDRTGHYQVDTTTQAGSLVNAGNTATFITPGAFTATGSAIAAHNVAIGAGTVTVAAGIDSSRIDQQGIGRYGYERLAEGTQGATGGVVTAGNNLTIVSTGALNLDAAVLQAGTSQPAGGSATTSVAGLGTPTGALTLVAGGPINVAGLHTEQSRVVDTRNERSGTFSSSRNREDLSTQQSLYTGSVVSGSTTHIQSGTDIAVLGSTVLGRGTTTVVATGSLTIGVGTQTLVVNNATDRSQTGFGAMGDLSWGTSQTSRIQRTTATNVVGSTVGSATGSVALQAGGTYRQTASDVLAPGGNVSIRGAEVTIEAGQDSQQSFDALRTRQTGVTIGFSNPIINAAQTVLRLADAASDTNSTRSQALAAAGGAATVYSAINAASAPGGGHAGAPVRQHASGENRGQELSATGASIGLSITLGTQSSQSQTQAQGATAQGSTVAAGGNVSIVATGAPQAANPADGGFTTGGTAQTPNIAPGSGNIRVQGSDITAGGNINLDAANAVSLAAAQSTHRLTSTHSNSAASVGVTIGLGEASGVSFQLAASQGRGNASGADLTHSNTHVVASGTTSIRSGGNTTLQGAVVSGNTVTASVGGNLLIESLQDSSTFRESNSNSGFGVSLCIPPLCWGASSANVSAGGSRINSNFASTGEQSAIRAGEGGFNVNVQGNTTLTGGAITSTQNAVNAGVNSFATGGTLTTSNLANNADYSATGWSVSVGTSGGSLSGSGGFGNASGNASSTTEAGISGIAGNTNLRTGDQETGLRPIFNADTVRNDVNAQVTISTIALPAAANAWGTFAGNRENDPTLSPEERACWREGGACRVAGHAIIGYLGGGPSGAAGAAASQIAVPIIDRAITEANVDPALRPIVLAGVSAVIGGVSGGTAGAIAGGNATVNNYLSHPDATRLQALRDKCKASCSAEERREMNTLIEQDRSTTVAYNSCIGINSAACNAVRSDFAAAAASYLATPADVEAWSQRVAQNSNGRYTAAQIADAYEAAYQGRPPSRTTQGDLSGVRDFVAGQLLIEPGLSRIAMTAVVHVSGSAAAALGNSSLGVRQPANSVRPHETAPPSRGSDAEAPRPVLATTTTTDPTPPSPAGTPNYGNSPSGYSGVTTRDANGNVIPSSVPSGAGNAPPLTSSRPSDAGTGVGSINVASPAPSTPGNAANGNPTYVPATIENGSVVLNRYTLDARWADSSGNLVWRNPLTNAVEPIPTGSRVHVDHILPQSYFQTIPGFNDLPASTRTALMDDPLNLQPMIASANCSKNCRVEISGNGWTTWGGQQVSGEYVNYLTSVQRAVNLRVNRAIAEFNRR